jgi:glucose-6-phosphate isomerase
VEPFKTELNLQTGVMQPVGHVIQRCLSGLRDLYADPEAVSEIIAEEGDRLIYEVHVADLPEREGLVLFCTTVIYPGQVGDEFHMTKGHFHDKRDRSEIYLGLTGEGYLLLQTEDGTVRGIPMQPGTIAYVPAMWAHRTANTGNEAFSFLAAWPGDAGHDYNSIEKTGFAKLLVDRGGRPVLIDNPSYAK